MAKFLHRNLGPPPASANDVDNGARYFLERSGSVRGRNIVNQTEFDDVLSEFSFEKVRRPEISVQEQNQKFGQAGIVLGAFGTDMVTMFQLHPGTDLIVLCIEEMRRETNDLSGRGIDSADAYIEQICAIIGVRLRRVYSTLVRRGPGYSYLQDMRVDCSALRQLLSDIIKRRAANSL